ncbi:DUF488 family protein [Thermodesulfobacteriota bacterium]
MRIYSIGHSNRTLEAFIDILKAYRVEGIADVRSWPSSRRFPHFNGESLDAQLKAEGIAYHWIHRLGGLRRDVRQDSPNNGLKAGPLRNYADYMETEVFRQGLEELLTRVEDERLAIMCAEALVRHCHRRILCDKLASLDIEVIHILDILTCERHRPTSFMKAEGDRLTYPAPRLEEQLELL